MNARQLSRAPFKFVPPKFQVMLLATMPAKSDGIATVNAALALGHKFSP